MLQAVNLAVEARQRFINSRTGLRTEDIKIALSLGPYGAMLTPAQEFDGCYPPPFGPKGYTAGGDNWNAFPEKDVAAQEAEDALMAFHLERLSVFSGHPESWKAIDFVAFETVPLAREILAIRKAVGMLQKDASWSGISDRPKPWWISTIYPGGQYPEEKTVGGDRLEIAEVVQAFLSGESVDYPTPSGIGLNCTAPSFVSRILGEIGRAVDALCLDSKERPFLVIYPNSGNVYDTTSRQWVHPENPDTRDEKDCWADSLANIACKERDSRRWSSIIVGGCCKTTPKHIEALSRLLQTSK